jgi:hypothetical protein
MFLPCQTQKYPRKNQHFKGTRGNNLGNKKHTWAEKWFFIFFLGRKVMYNLVVLENVQDKIMGKDFGRQQGLSCFKALVDKCFWEEKHLR